MVVLAGLVSGVVMADPADDAYQAALKLKTDKDYAAAVPALEKVAADYPALAGGARLNKALCMCLLDQHADALKEIDSVLKTYADDKKISSCGLNYMGIVLSRARRYEEALVPLEKAMPITPESGGRCPPRSTGSGCWGL